MSTDESDQETPDASQFAAKTYRVRVPIWRAPLLTLLLRWLDKIYLIIRRMFKSNRGALPRIRILPDAETEATIRSEAYANMTSMSIRRAKFPNNLAKCAYDTTWFDIVLGDGFDLRYIDTQWDFSTINPELFA